MELSLDDLSSKDMFQFLLMAASCWGACQVTWKLTEIAGSLCKTFYGALGILIRDLELKAAVRELWVHGTKDNIVFVTSIILVFKTFPLVVGHFLK